nr:hypothetical protein [Tanacetum cinerariifolium]
MARLAFCDYHNMMAILEKYEHNRDFHQIVDFVEASHIRIKTTDEETKILATIDGKPRTIFESSIRRNLKLNDEAGISSLPDTEIFENLTLMGVNSPSFLGRTVPLFDSMLVTMGEGLGTPTKPHHTPTPEAQQSPPTAYSSPSLPPATTETIPTVTPTDILTHRQYHRRARIAQSSALPTAADEPASPFGDGGQEEAFPTVSGLEAEHDRENIIKTSALPHDSPPRVTSLAADEGNLEITSLKARIKLLEDKDGGGAEPSREDTIIKGRSLETGEEAASILTSGVQVVSVPPATKVATIGVPTGSGLKMVALDTPKKKKLQEQIDIHVAREIKEQMAREDQRSEQITRDAEIARIHAEEELQMLIDGLDRNNEYQAQQRRPLSKKQQREFYISVLKSHYGWKIKHFRGMILEEIREKFLPVWKQIEDFVSMASTEEGKRIKRKGFRLEHESTKKMKTPKEVSEEDLKEMMQLVPVEEVYMEALQIKHPIIDWKIHTEGKKEYWKISSLGGNTAVYQFLVDMLKHFNREDLNQLWTLVKETLSIR